MRNTESTPINGVDRLTLLRQKVEHLFSLDKITVKDLEHFEIAEREYLSERCTAILRDLKDTERDRFLDQIDAILPADTKSQVWEANHVVISSAVAKYIKTHGIMPAKNAIAEQTGLTRQTVARHFKDYQQRPEFAAEAGQFKFMAPNLLASVFKFALNGDTRAARLYFEMIGALNARQNHTLVSNQNNYIQINNTILSQENLQQLTAEQLNQIERIIRDGGVKGNL